MEESKQEEEINDMKLAEGVRLLYNKPSPFQRKVKFVNHVFFFLSCLYP